MNKKYSKEDYTRNNAFPCETFMGMDLLDYFAAKALPQVMFRLESDKFASLSANIEDIIAEQSYAIAKAMIRAKDNIEGDK